MNLTYGIDMGAPNGDTTALTIKVGKTLYTYVGEEAEAIIALIASEVAKAELAMLDRLTEPHHDTMHGTYDYDGIAESVLNERNTLEGKL